MTHPGWLAALSALALGTVSLGQIQVAARVQGSSSPPTLLTGLVNTTGNHVTISSSDLNSIGGNTDYVLWVYDQSSTTGAPLQSIGSITINWDGLHPVNFVRLIIAPAPVTGATNSQDDFKAAPIDPMSFSGAVDLGSIIVTNDDFRQRVGVAVAVTGDVGSLTASPRQKIEVGQIYRVQASGRTVNSELVGGNIYADITATWVDYGETFGSVGLPTVTPFDALAYVTAAKSIQGTLKAAGIAPGVLDAGSHRGSINTVRLTDASAAGPGITGDLLAEWGRIRTVITTGKIGTSESNRSTIKAGLGIGQIRALDASSQVLDRDFFADTQSNAAIPPTTGGTSPIGVGQINRLQTAGDYYGDIVTDNIGATAYPGGGATFGVLLGGVMHGSITVRNAVLSASIVATTFEEPIVIGSFLKGSVIATASDGAIPSLSVGFSPPPGEEFNVGFRGTQCELWSRPFLEVSRCDAVWGEPQSIISASYAGEIKLARMHITNKLRYPRVEIPVIGRLEIGDLLQGVIWSGNMDYALNSDGSVQFVDGRPVLANLEANDYASIGELQIGCIGPEADIWYQDCPDALVTGNMRGEIHVPSIESSQKLRIGNRLGVPGDPCACTSTASCFLGVDGSDFEDSPRSYGFVPWGQVYIRDEDGLAGQVIINGGNNSGTPEVLWAGDVVVGTAASSPEVIGPERLGITIPADLIRPLYSRPSAPLGGGAVGLAPFRLYETDCVPPHDVDGYSYGVLESAANKSILGNRTVIKARFYGPVAKKNSAQTWAQHLRVQCRPLDPDGPNTNDDPGNVDIDPCSWQDASTVFDYYGPGQIGPDGSTMWADARSLGLRVRNDRHAAPGVYRLYPYQGDSVRSAKVDGNPAVEWPVACTDSGDEPSYVFVIAPDCDNDNLRDDTEDSSVSCGMDCGLADWNNSGTVTVQDIFDFLAHYFVPCTGFHTPVIGCWRSADVNGSGTVTVQDIFDYLAEFFSWNGADCPPD